MNKMLTIHHIFNRWEWDSLSEETLLTILRAKGMPITSLFSPRCPDGTVTSQALSDGVMISWEGIKSKKWNHE
jgi:hypothetical protein